MCHVCCECTNNKFRNANINVQGDDGYKMIDEVRRDLFHTNTLCIKIYQTDKWPNSKHKVLRNIF